MSYVNITPAYYQSGVPGTPFRHGAPGWETAWVPGWGENPNQAWASVQAAHGFGSEEAEERHVPFFSAAVLVPGFIGVAAGAAGAYYLLRKRA